MGSPETIYMFKGTGGAMAYSAFEDGRNLPQDFAPWEFRRAVSTSGPTFRAGADKRALQEVENSGFAVAVFQVTIEGEQPSK